MDEAKNHYSEEVKTLRRKVQTTMQNTLRASASECLDDIKRTGKCYLQVNVVGSIVERQDVCRVLGWSRHDPDGSIDDSLVVREQGMSVTPLKCALGGFWVTARVMSH
jgi:hypothetical protein